MDLWAFLLLTLLWSRPKPSGVGRQLDDSLLPGEDPVHIQGGDVEHWIAVYEELLAGNCRILEEMRSQGSSQAIELHVRRLEIGLAFWTRQRNRKEGLASPSPGPNPAAVLAMAAWVDLRMPEGARRR
jgi:hypothetical protein